jgi:colanic acid/amylovoran biosynthesis glycosyltransferase
MRVGFVVGQFPTLSETFVISQMGGLLQRGASVGVVCNGIADYAYPDREKEPLSRLLPETRDWWGGISGLRPRIDRLPPSVKDKVSTALDGLSARRLNDFDVIVAHFGHNGARVARLKKRRPIDPPIVTIFHGYDVGVPLHEAGLDRYRDLFRLGTLCLTVNDLFRQILIKAGASPERVAVHRMGIDVTQIPYARQPRQGVTLQLISVCRLAEKKGTEFALRALGRLRISNPDLDWRYTIIGDGPLRDDLQRLAGQLGISDRVAFLGGLPHQEVKLWLSRSHVFILPSVTASNGDVEGIPVALMEAMASGLTVLSSYHSGIPELIEDRKTGFLAAEKDVDALAERIRWIAEHPQECEQIAVAARRKVETEYNTELLNDRFATLLTDLVETRSRT